MQFSIIIPVYNVEKYLPECIESILIQTYKEFELILVDDGSKDSSGLICDEYAQRDSHIHVIHQSNAGVSKARNAGLSVAKGEWITFIDSDDWVDEDFLENFNIETNADCDLICQGLKYIDHSTRNEKRRTSFDAATITEPDEEQLVKRYDILCFGVTVCKCFRRNIIEKFAISFDKKISYHEDHLFTLEYISHTTKIVTTTGCGYNYRCGHNPDSLSKKKHIWQSQELASKRLMECLSRIRTVYHVDEKYYANMATFCIGPRVNAAEGIYNEPTIVEKKQQMLSILSPLNEIAKYYKPGNKNKIISQLAKDKSGTLLHLFFWIKTRIKK